MKLASHKLLLSVDDVFGLELLSTTLANKRRATVQQHEFPHKPTLDTCRSRYQQISTLFHVLLKAYPGLEIDVGDGKAGSSVCHQLELEYVLQYF